MKLIIGIITFLDPQIDGVNKAIVHEVHGVLNCGSGEQAQRIGENLLDEFESYIIPEIYDGEIEWECLAVSSFDVMELEKKKSSK
jgi:hypothetical protein